MIGRFSCAPYLGLRVLPGGLLQSELWKVESDVYRQSAADIAIFLVVRTRLYCNLRESTGGADTANTSKYIVLTHRHRKIPLKGDNSPSYQRSSD